VTKSATDRPPGHSCNNAAARGDILGALDVAAEAKTAGTLVSALAAAGETQRRAKRDLTDEEKGALGRPNRRLTTDGESGLTHANFPRSDPQ